MKRNICIPLVGVAVLCLSSAAWAQRGIGKTAGKLINGKMISNTSKETADLVAKQTALYKQLERRALVTSNLITNSALLKGDFSTMQDPQTVRKLNAKLTKKAFPKDVNPYELYPNAPEGLTRESLGYYVITKDNLEARKLELERSLRRVQVEELLQTPGFMDEIRLSSVVPFGHEAQWLALTIQPDTQYLLIGEEHYSANVNKTIATVLKEIRNTGGREILLFSEFCPEGVRSDPSHGLTDVPSRGRKSSVLRMAGEMKIPVIGLEPGFVYYSNNPTIWARAKVETLRLRNERWLKTIRRYREQYPNALFIIHAGWSHISYGELYSLGDALAGEKTFVAEVGYIEERAEPKEEEAEYLRQWNLNPEEFGFKNFDDVLREKNRVLWIKDPQAARLVGFDARITVRP